MYTIKALSGISPGGRVSLVGNMEQRTLKPRLAFVQKVVSSLVEAWRTLKPRLAFVQKVMFPLLESQSNF